MFSRRIYCRSLRPVTILNISLNNGNLRRFLSDGVSQNHYDIVVAGGGMIGTTLACTLGKNTKLSEKKILLLEGGKQSKWSLPEKYANRVSTISIEAQKLLDSIGAWPHVQNARFCPVQKMQVWEATSEAMITFENDLSGDVVGYVVENDVLLNSVQQELPKIGNVSVVYESKISHCRGPDATKNSVTISLENGTSYTCDLVLGCDGSNSQVRKSMGIHYISKQYGHMGVVATLKLQQDADNVVAWQRHLPNSQYVALLPLAPDLSSLVWSTSAQRAKELVGLTEDQFVDAVNEAFCGQFPQSAVVQQASMVFDNLLRFVNCPSNSTKEFPPKIINLQEGSRAAFPLGIGHATNYVSKGVALVGDAAHRVHPLAGQGLNLGYGDIVCLNKTLADAVYSGGKIGDITTLKSYETERQRHNIPTMLATHGLFYLYSTEFAPLALVRALGLQAAHAMTPLKRAFIAHASGQ